MGLNTQANIQWRWNTGLRLLGVALDFIPAGYGPSHTPESRLRGVHHPIAQLPTGSISGHG
jgi:hypothetical protein